jgi:hypothetical protein
MELERLWGQQQVAQLLQKAYLEQVTPLQL